MSTLLVLSAVGNLGKKGTIMVVHHTDCGLQTASDDDIRASLEKSVDGTVSLEQVKFGSFEDPEVSAKEDVDLLKSSPFFKGMQILGFVMDTKSGILKCIE
jgi:carbonic anhydrase